MLPPLSNSYKLELKPLARQDIIDILKFTQLRWGREKRGHYKALIDKCLQTIAKNPHPISQSERAIPGYYRRHLGERSRHYIFYRIEGDTVTVVRILYDAMEFESYLD